jgi:hypothetical protein
MSLLSKIINLQGQSSSPSGPVHETCTLKIEDPNSSNYTIITESPVIIQVGDTAIQITQTPGSGVWIKHFPPYMHRMDQFFKLWSEADNEARVTSCRFMWIKYWVRATPFGLSYPAHRSLGTTLGPCRNI